MVSMEWEEKQLKRLILSARSDGKTTLVYGNKKREITMKKGERLEVSVMQLATSPSANSLLDNVNRWRRQMQLPPIIADQLSTETTTLDLAGGQATLVNLLGTFAGGGMGSAALGHGDAQPPNTPAGPAQ